MTINQNDKTKCCGCASCVAVCQTHSLSMHKDRKGFSYPTLNTKSCVDCGKCVRVCPIQNQPAASHAEIAYATWATTPNPLSTSGGIAYQISKEFVSRGGIVYGCSSASTKVSHIRVSSVDSLNDLCGSKYVQSDISFVYERMKDDLESGNKVLFISVPCQVAAIRNHFRNRLQNIYLMDILCHGTPSQQMFDEHISSIAKGRTIKSISFRDGDDYRLKVSGEGWNREASFLHDSYIAGFLNSITLRESCTECLFASDDRCSDITIGDFWGLGARIPFTNEHPNKVSLSLPLTEKGTELMAMVKEEIVTYERPVQEAVEGNYPLRVPAKRTFRYSLFNCLYKFMPFGIAVRLCLLDVYAKKSFQIISRRICRRR